ncbi:MAG: hypothetical protein J7K21_00790 [Desulfurococcales archaeon]|nr:hypothetical protein [Desulfurococcales archaeon]
MRRVIGLKEGTNYAIAGPVNKYLPTNVHVPGCPPEPATIVKALTMITEKHNFRRVYLLSF